VFIWTLTRRILAVSLSFCLTLTSIGSGIAIACEGAAEQQKIAIGPIEWGEGGTAKKEKCPLKPGTTKVLFTQEGQWCEFAVENKNNKEEIEIEKVILGNPLAECTGLPKGVGKCINFKVPTIKMPECDPEVKLAVNKACVLTIEYENKPKNESNPYFRIETISTGGGRGKETEEVVVK
jgi:hypothetical protein